MGFFGVVRVNGVPRFTSKQVLFPDGTAALPGVAFTSQPGIGLQLFDAAGFSVNTLGVQRMYFGAGISMDSDLSLRWTNSATNPNTTTDLSVVREAANTVKFFDGSTNASTVLLGSIDIRQTASTFAQTATITNGPRAANPVAWIEVKVSGSTGRIPVW